MMCVRMLAAVTAAALVGHTPATAFALVPGGPGGPPAEASSPRVTSAVTGVSIVPSAGRAAVVIAVDSSVQMQDFVLESAPYRLVFDLTGAKLGVAPRFYDHVPRGGITDIRYAQYRAGVVRVVIQLDGPHEYTTARTAHELRV